MLRLALLFTLNLLVLFVKAQEKGTVLLKIVTDKSKPITGASVELLTSKDSSLVKVLATDSLGTARFEALKPGLYFCRISRVDYQVFTTAPFKVSGSATHQVPTITLYPASQTLSTITVNTRKSFIELMPDKTVVNIDAGITHVGSTVLEALEKLPGISVDKDGNIALKGRSGVSVMIDGKLTYLNKSELANLLQGMSTTQISKIEIIDNPTAHYDAAGNAGLINIITKKEKSGGFNGSLNTSYSQGAYAKSNHGVQLNYQSGKWNVFANYALNIPRNFSKLYALRTYFEPDEKTVSSFLEQPSFFKINSISHSLRTGVDFAMSKKTTIGFTVNGISANRSNSGNNTAVWMNASRQTDSLILTESKNSGNWKNAGASFNFQHQFKPDRQVTADVDYLGYCIRGNQFFENTLLAPGSYVEASRAYIPSDIRILSGKADYSQQVKKVKLDGGWKLSHITTDNLASYENREGNDWKEDLSRTNHFLYKEDIQAAYASSQANLQNWTLQAGLRYERTQYNAHQLGNSLVKDSAFSRHYNSLFPDLFVSYAADSLNSFSLIAARRIDRPAFQSLNPFLFIINKYTYQQGNPFFRPQYTWSIELTHSYKGLLTTSASYSIVNDFFSQIFPVDNDGIVIYTEGNLGRLSVAGVSVSTQLSPLPWWSFSAQATLNHKKLEGQLWKKYEAEITQLDANMTHRAFFGKGWSVELSGFYTSRSQQDIQEIVEPTGSLSLGVSKNILQNKGTVKLAGRDLFYTQRMKGITDFQQANEHFSLNRDTRLLALSFTFRFGKGLKLFKPSPGAAGEEIRRVGNE